MTTSGAVGARLARLRHGVLEAGGVGGLLAAFFARAGRKVVLVMRPGSLARYDGRLQVESALLGSFEIDVYAAPQLDRPVDVLWVTPNATQLEAALELVPPELLGESVVVPLLNGIDHVELLRRRLGAERVLPATINVESERVGVGRVRQKSAFVQLELAPHPCAAAICAEAEAADLACGVGSSEPAVLWRKLATPRRSRLRRRRCAPLSAVVADEAWQWRLEACAREIASIAAADDVEFDADAALARYEQAGDLRSSMQKDREAGLPLGAIGGAVPRAASRHGLEASATAGLVDQIGRTA